MKGLIAKVNRQFSQFILSFAYLLCSGIKDDGERLEWLPQVERNFFNDMRHKDPYRQFLETYLQAYRQVKGVTVESAPDPQWEAMVATATAARDSALPNVNAVPPYRADEDLAKEVQLVLS